MARQSAEVQMISNRWRRKFRLVLAGFVMLFVIALLSWPGLSGLQKFTTVRALSVTPQSNDCKCTDLPALVNRRREVTAAINAIDGQMSQLEADERNANKVFGYTDYDYSRYFSEPIEKAVGAAH